MMKKVMLALVCFSLFGCIADSDYRGRDPNYYKNGYINQAGPGGIGYQNDQQYSPRSSQMPTDRKEGFHK